MGLSPGCNLVSGALNGGRGPARSVCSPKPLPLPWVCEAEVSLLGSIYSVWWVPTVCSIVVLGVHR